MKKNRKRVVNTLNKKTPKNKTVHEVGIKTKFYVTKNADVYSSVNIVGSHNRNREVKVPASTLMYWYPFYFYYDWGFKGKTNKWVLKVSENAPEEARKYLYKDLLFTDCVDLKTFETKDNKIYRDNLALMNSLSELSDGNFATLLTPEVDEFSILANTEFIASTIASIKQNCKDRYDQDYLEHFNSRQQSKERFEVLSTKEAPRDRLLYDKYATDEELALLIKMGAASRVTYVLKKFIGEI